MTTPEDGQDPTLRLEQYDSSFATSVSKLLMKLELQPRPWAEGNPMITELGLTFHSGLEPNEYNARVDEIFAAHPELEAVREAMDKEWWETKSPDEKAKWADELEELFEERKKFSKVRSILQSPFAADFFRVQINHHLEHGTAQNRLVVVRDAEVLGYLAAWSGSSVVYEDGDHLQIDVKVVDLDLSPDEQREVAAQFEPTLTDLSLP